LVDAEREELQMAYAFEGVDLPKFEGYALDSMKAVFGRWDIEFANKGWLSIFLSNQDQDRMVSRWGNDSPEFRNASASLLNTFILSMRGTPYCYYGDELGMTNIDFDTITQYNDIAAINSYQKALAAGTAMDDFMKRLNFTSRDNGRTPMQWTGAYQGGFTSGTPWLPVHENHKFLNVANQNHEPGSVLNHFRSLTRLRREHPVLVHGTYGLLDVFNSKVYAYLRTLGSERMLVLLNFSDEVSEFIVPEEFKPAARLIDNYPDSKMDWGRLEPWQAQIYQLK
jgi:oligo-1,6-glucosidase